MIIENKTSINVLRIGTLAILCVIFLNISCKGCAEQRISSISIEGGKVMSSPISVIHAKIIRAGANGDPLVLDKDEFLDLVSRAPKEEADQIETIVLGENVPNDKNSWMDKFRTRHFKSLDLMKSLSTLEAVQLEKSDLKLVWQYTSDALNKNKFAFIPNSSIENASNKDLFTDKMVDASGYLYLCLGYKQEDPKIEGVKAVKLPEPKKTKDGLMYMPGEALQGRQCIVYVPKAWFGAGSQHKGFYPHDYSVSLNMLLELADRGDTEFIDMIANSFDNFKSLAENIGHIPNANKSWSIGDTSRTQTNTLVSQVLLYAKYIEETKGEEAAKKWLEDIGLPIAENNLAFLTAKRAKTPQGFYRFVPIGKTPDDPKGDTYVYTSEMHNSPVLHNFYFERLLSDLINTYESRSEKPNYCSSENCLKYIEEISDPGITGKLKPRDLLKLVNERKDAQGISGEELISRTKFAEKMSGLVFVWNHPVRGEELIIKSPKTGKLYRLTNYALGSDQAMRASGFDPSDMAGLNSLDALDTAYAGHNAQLYRQVKDMAKIYKRLGKEKPAQEMEKKAAELKQAIIKNMWSEKYGELVPFHQEKGRVDYRFFDMSYALWAHLFDTNNPVELAKLMSVVRNVKDYEGPEGPYASTDWSGHNWGWGKVWPVMAAYAFIGLRDYAQELRKTGLSDEAKLLEDTAQRIALKWLYSNAEMFAKEYGFGENLAIRKDDKPLENIYGYNIDPKKAGNYTWHVVITRWLYTQLNPGSKKLFDAFYSTLKAKNPDKL